MTSLVMPIRQGAEAELRFPADLDAAEFEDIKSYLETFLRVQGRKAGRAVPQKPEPEIAST